MAVLSLKSVSNAFMNSCKLWFHILLKCCLVKQRSSNCFLPFSSKKSSKPKSIRKVFLQLTFAKIYGRFDRLFESFCRGLFHRPTSEHSFSMSFVTREVSFDGTFWRAHWQIKLDRCCCLQVADVQSFDSVTTQIETDTVKTFTLPFFARCFTASLPPLNEESSSIL